VTSSLDYSPTYAPIQSFLNAYLQAFGCGTSTVKLFVIYLVFVSTISIFLLNCFSHLMSSRASSRSSTISNSSFFLLSILFWRPFQFQFMGNSFGRWIFRQESPPPSSCNPSTNSTVKFLTQIPTPSCSPSSPHMTCPSLISLVATTNDADNKSHS
jgi:hypothetical protein